jgi:outer membrane lipoprotein SlyB
MKTHYILGAVILFASLGLSGCATYVPVQGSVRAPVYQANYPPKNQKIARVEYGTVTKVEMLQAQRTSPISLGSLVGGGLGGLIGHQMGGGRGKTALTIAGAVGGDAVQKSIEKDRVIVTVRTDSGAELVAEQPAHNQVLRLGDRVRIERNVMTRIEDRLARKK